MRSETKRVIHELRAGKELKDIMGNPKTKSRALRIYLYGQAIQKLTNDILFEEYTYSTYELKKLISRKK